MAITFLATSSMLQSAIQIAGDGGARLKLDLDDSQVDAIPPLMAMRGEVLSVTVELVDEPLKNNAISTREKRQPKWTTTKGAHMD